MTTGWVWHDAYTWYTHGPSAAFLPSGGHLQPGDHWDTGEAHARFAGLVAVSGLLDSLQPLHPVPATREQIGQLHAPEYVERVMGQSSVNARSAALAVGGCLAAVRAVMGGDVTNGYALVRPPGHHATADRGGGGCVFNNVALSALEALRLGAGRVAIVDWDAHHGNGTQEAFWRMPRVLTISLHQARPFAPHTGGVDALGGDDAFGTNLNMPLPPGAGRGAYIAAFEAVVVPALERFRPDLVLVSSGLDANTLDPGARLMLHSEAYRELTRLLMACARDSCGGRLIACHEGGYAAGYVPFCGLAVVEEMAGVRTGVDDPFLAHWGAFLSDQPQPHELEAIRLAAGNLPAVPGP